MKQPQPAAVLALGFLLFLSANLPAQTAPWSNGTLKDRIALSHDGNFNDEDNWGPSRPSSLCSTPTA